MDVPGEIWTNYTPLYPFRCIVYIDWSPLSATIIMCVRDPGFGLMFQDACVCILMKTLKVAQTITSYTLLERQRVRREYEAQVYLCYDFTVYIDL